MKITNENKKFWASLWQQGDVTKISKASGIHRHAIAGAYDAKECGVEVFFAIEEFYKKRKALIDKFISEKV